MDCIELGLTIARLGLLAMIVLSSVAVARAMDRTRTLALRLITLKA